MQTTTEDITLGGRTVVVTHPVGEGPWPGVVMLHEIFGLDDIVRRQAQRLASAGYLVFTPDLFGEGLKIRCIQSAFRALRAQSGPQFDLIDSCRAQVLADQRCSGKAGVIGFCMGGGFALLMSSRGFDASAVNYGMVPENLEDALTGACPIVGSFGGKDKMLAREVPRLEAMLEARQIPHDVKTYPTAGHCFMNDAETGPRLLRPLMKVNHVGPDPDSAADAWGRIEAFFGEHLVS